MRDSEERYRALAENSHDIICELNEEFCFLYTSPNVLDVLGLNKDWLNGKSIFELIHIDDMPLVLSELQKEFTRFIYRAKHITGEWIWFESTAKIFFTASGEKRMVVISRDITEQKRMEQQLIQTEKLTAIGEMSAMIAHEFRNGLTSIKMILQLHSESLKKNSSEQESLNVAINSIYHMEDVVQQLLNFAQPAPRELQIEDINRIISECISIIEMQANNMEIELIKKFSKTLPQILIHTTSIKESVINLLLNAIHAFENKHKSIKRKITISTHKNILKKTLIDFDFGTKNELLGIESSVNDHQEIIIHKGTECVVIEITDNGSGINKVYLNRIFEPFFTTKEKGSGLGLSIVKRNINVHGGIIEISSALNVGTTFTIYLPIISKLD